MTHDNATESMTAPCEFEQAVRSIEERPEQLRKDTNEATAIAIRFYLRAKADAGQAQRKFRLEYETQSGRIVTANVIAVNSAQAWLSVVMHHAEFGEIAAQLLSVRFTGVNFKREVVR